MKRKILLVDDEKEILDIIGIRLSSLNFKVLKANSSEQALQLFSQENPDIAIIDVCMPTTNGYQICKRIREIDKNHAKIIMHTGQVDAVDCGKAREAGANDFAVKTGDFDLLIKTIELHLSKNT